MNTRVARVLLGLGLSVFALAASSPASQGKPDNAKVLGTWKVEVYAGDQSYILSLVVSETEGTLQGKISESMGGFTDVALEEIFLDGEYFRFNFTSPTPPDGLNRTINVEFKVGAETMEGTFTVSDLDAVADAKATRESK